MTLMNPVNFLIPTSIDANNITRQQDFDLSEFVVQLKHKPLLPVFSLQSMSFIQQLSRTLLKDGRCKQHPELVALGFWLRKSNLTKLLQQQGFSYKDDTVVESPATHKQAHSSERQPLGLVLHFTPANVDTMFIYSWITSLLLGNSNIVRIASKDSELQTLLLLLIKQLFELPEHNAIADRNFFISYPKEAQATAVLCAGADARLIWGGDQSVANIQAHQAPPKCVDLCFSDKFSVAIIAGINAENVKQTAQLLWRDTQPYLQQACSSPRIIYWLCANRIDANQSKTWLKELLQKLNELAAQNTQSGWHTISQANEHLVTAQQIMATSKQLKLPELLNHASITGINVDSVNVDMLERHSGNGFFICVLCDSLTSVFDHIAALDNNKLQTLTYANVSPDDLLKHKQNKSITSIDRIVPLGQALDFSFDWDGYDLLRSLSAVGDPA